MEELPGPRRGFLKVEIHSNNTNATKRRLFRLVRGPAPGWSVTWVERTNDPPAGRQRKGAKRRSLPSLQGALVPSLSTTPSISDHSPAYWSDKSSRPCYPQLFAKVSSGARFRTCTCYLWRFGSPPESRAGLKQLRSPSSRAEDSPLLPLILSHTCKLISVSKHKPKALELAKMTLVRRDTRPGSRRIASQACFGSLSSGRPYTPAYECCIASWLSSLSGISVLCNTFQCSTTLSPSTLSQPAQPVSGPFP